MYNMRNTMPAKAPKSPQTINANLLALGQKIRAHRKTLRVSAVTAALSAGISRVTLHRIERGAPSVTIGAYMNVIAALGMSLTIADQNHLVSAAADHAQAGTIPVRIQIDEYPQLKQLAWQVNGTNELRPLEAFGIYERNLRHLDFATLEPHERNLIDGLREVFEENHRAI